MGTVTPITARNRRAAQYPALLTPAEVARAFQVDPKTVTRWANSGKLRTIRTIGGHRRFLEAEVRALLAESRQERTP